MDEQRPADQNADHPPQPPKRVPDHLRPTVVWESEPTTGPLQYRAAAADNAANRQYLRNTHKERFKAQMGVGIAVGLIGSFLWLGSIFTGGAVNLTFTSTLFAAILVAWAVTSIVVSRTGGFVVGVLISVGVLLLITGCGVAAVCGGIFK